MRVGSSEGGSAAVRVVLQDLGWADNSEGGLAAVGMGRQQCTYVGTMVDVGVISHLTLCSKSNSNNNSNTRRSEGCEAAVRVVLQD